MTIANCQCRAKRIDSLRRNPPPPSLSNKAPDELSSKLRRLLHRALHLQPDSRHAERQTGRRALHPVGRR
jgi:hypothetical protein